MSIFKFKKFNVDQTSAPQKIGTDAMVLGALVEMKNPKSILDVGTGCGVIALMLAQNNPSAKITGLDIDKEAVLQAKSNFENANFPNHFEVVHQNFLAYTPVHKVDLIVSNPPYFNSKMPSSNHQRSLARHEKSMSLQQLINHSADLLNCNGELWIIVPSVRTEELIATKESLKLTLNQRIKIYGKPHCHVRDVLVFSTSQSKNSDNIKQLTIRNEERQYTDQYKSLTIDFHFYTL